MNSTDANASPESRELFDRRIVPLAAAMKRDGKTLLPRHPDPAAASYYVTRTKPVMTRENFEIPALQSTDALEPGLRAFWESHAEPQLAELASDLARLAKTLRREQEVRDSAGNDNGEVSPFRYVMF